MDLDDHTVDELQHRGRSLLPREFVVLVQRGHDDDQPGVAPETLSAYAAAMDQGQLDDFEEGDLLDAVAAAATDADDWQGDKTIYRVGDDRVSGYPREWHDRLGSETDLRAFVDAMEDAQFSEGGSGRGVPESHLLDAAAAIGGLDRDAAQADLQRLRNEGELVEGADQHPQGLVVLPGDVDEDLRDPTLE
jgi:hypothetical protein